MQSKPSSTFYHKFLLYLLSVDAVIRTKAFLDLSPDSARSPARTIRLNETAKETEKEVTVLTETETEAITATAVAVAEIEVMEEIKGRIHPEDTINHLSSC